MYQSLLNMMNCCVAPVDAFGVNFDEDESILNNDEAIYYLECEHYHKTDLPTTLKTAQTSEDCLSIGDQICEDNLKEIEDDEDEQDEHVECVTPPLSPINPYRLFLHTVPATGNSPYCSQVSTSSCPSPVHNAKSKLALFLEQVPPDSVTVSLPPTPIKPERTTSNLALFLREHPSQRQLLK